MHATSSIIDRYDPDVQLRLWKAHRKDLYQLSISCELSENVHITLDYLPFLASTTDSPGPSTASSHSTFSSKHFYEQAIVTGTTSGRDTSVANFVEILTVRLPVLATGVDSPSSSFPTETESAALIYDDFKEEAGGLNRVSMSDVSIAARFYHAGNVQKIQHMPSNPNFIATSSSDGSLYLFDVDSVDMDALPNCIPTPQNCRSHRCVGHRPAKSRYQNDLHDEYVCAFDEAVRRSWDANHKGQHALALPKDPAPMAALAAAIGGGGGVVGASSTVAAAGSALSPSLLAQLVSTGQGGGNSASPAVSSSAYTPMTWARRRPHLACAVGERLTIWDVETAAHVGLTNAASSSSPSSSPFPFQNCFQFYTVPSPIREVCFADDPSDHVLYLATERDGLLLRDVRTQEHSTIVPPKLHCGGESTATSSVRMHAVAAPNSSSSSSSSSVGGGAVGGSSYMVCASFDDGGCYVYDVRKSTSSNDRAAEYLTELSPSIDPSAGAATVPSRGRKKKEPQQHQPHQPVPAVPLCDCVSKIQWHPHHANIIATGTFPHTNSIKIYDLDLASSASSNCSQQQQQSQEIGGTGAEAESNSNSNSAVHLFNHIGHVGSTTCDFAWSPHTEFGACGQMASIGDFVLCVWKPRNAFWSAQ